MVFLENETIYLLRNCGMEENMNPSFHSGIIQSLSKCIIIALNSTTWNLLHIHALLHSITIKVWGPGIREQVYSQ